MSPSLQRTLLAACLAAAVSFIIYLQATRPPTPPVKVLPPIPVPPVTSAPPAGIGTTPPRQPPPVIQSPATPSSEPAEQNFIRGMIATLDDADRRFRQALAASMNGQPNADFLIADFATRIHNANVAGKASLEANGASAYDIAPSMQHALKALDRYEDAVAELKTFHAYKRDKDILRVEEVQESALAERRALALFLK